MINEIIKSKTVREYIEKTGWHFSDKDIATIIYNSGFLNPEESHYYMNIVNETEDMDLVGEIAERVSYKGMAYQRFTKNDGDCFYETREWIPGERDADDVTGHFATFNTAVEYAKKFGTTFQIRKYQLIDRCPTIITPQASFNPRLGIEWEAAERPYQGEPISEFCFNADGEFQLFWSSEMSAEEEKKVDDWGEKRFEHRFAVLPNPFERGDIVYIADDCDSIGIVETSQAEWKDFLKRVEERSLPVDFIDASVTVEFLHLDGSFSHNHIAPIFLEKAELDKDDERLPLLNAASRLVRGEGSLDEFLYLHGQYRV